MVELTTRVCDSDDTTILGTGVVGCLFQIYEGIRKEVLFDSLVSGHGVTEHKDYTTQHKHNTCFNLPSVTLRTFLIHSLL
jgi:hypothetical protein